MLKGLMGFKDLVLDIDILTPENISVTVYDIF